MSSTSEHASDHTTTMTDEAARGGTAATPEDARNRLLLAMPAEERARLLPRLEPFMLEPMQVLAEPDAPIAHVYFPEGGVISLLRRMADGSLIESGTVGLEGMAGLPVFLDVDWSLGMIAGQIPGGSLRMDARAFHAATARMPCRRAHAAPSW